MNTLDSSHRKAVIGTQSSFWLYDSETGFDLTHPATPTSTQLVPRACINTTTLPITVHPAHSALLVIDMQNFFLSPSLGRPATSAGLKAQAQLLEHAIPAARKAGLRIIWLNWGLTDEELVSMPPSTYRAFGFETVPASEFSKYQSTIDKTAAIDSHGVNEAAPEISKSQEKKTVMASGKNPRIYKGLGTEIGLVTTEAGEVVEGGRLLFRDSWNAALTPELDAAYRQGLSAPAPDVWIHKNRMSGLWGSSTMCTEFLAKEGIRTLFFTGVNTDQCVGGSLQDAFTKGYDCVLLSDGCGTTSPSGSQESIEFNCSKTWGFSTTCQEFAKGLERMQR
jgi:nicotinamidase-related amidase